MKLKEIVLAGAMLLSSVAFAQSSDKLHFDVYSKRDGSFIPKLNTGSLRIASDEVDFSFLFGIYSMNFKKVNDSTYQEIVRDNLLWDLKEEFFYYSFKNSRYTLKDYFVVGGKPREEKEALKGKVFDKKYKMPLEILSNFEENIKKDSLHFIAFGEPYSVGKKEVIEKGDTIYSYILGKPIKKELGDFIIFPYPTKIILKKKDGKFIPFEFYTKSLNLRNKNENSIEGKLKEEK